MKGSSGIENDKPTVKLRLKFDLYFERRCWRINSRMRK